MSKKNILGCSTCSVLCAGSVCSKHYVFDIIQGNLSTSFLPLDALLHCCIILTLVPFKQIVFPFIWACVCVCSCTCVTAETILLQDHYPEKMKHLYTAWDREHFPKPPRCREREREWGERERFPSEIRETQNNLLYLKVKTETRRTNVVKYQNYENQTTASVLLDTLWKTKSIPEHKPPTVCFLTAWCISNTKIVFFKLASFNLQLGWLKKNLKKKIQKEALSSM